MLTGEQLFRGETITDVLAAIVNSEPDLSKVSPRAQRLIRACLEKEARHRLQAIGDAWLLLESGANTRQGGPHLSWGALLMALSVGIVAIAAAGMWARWRQPTVERRPLQFQVNLPEGVRLVEGTSGGSALSPDGRTDRFRGYGRRRQTALAAPLRLAAAARIDRNERRRFSVLVARRPVDRILCGKQAQESRQQRRPADCAR